MLVDVPDLGDEGGALDVGVAGLTEAVPEGLLWRK